MSKKFVYNGYLSCPSAALSYIAGLENDYGSALGFRQKDVICTTFNMLYGKGTPNGSDLSSKFITNTNARLFLYCPQNDTTANATAYRRSVNNQVGTFVNFVSGDFTVNGAIGGAGKYLNFGVATSAFSTNNMSFGVYNRTNVIGGSSQEMGTSGAASANASFVNLRNNTNNLIARVNSTTGGTAFSNTDSSGFFEFSRLLSSEFKVYRNGSLLSTVSNTSSGTTTNNM